VESIYSQTSQKRTPGGPELDVQFPEVSASQRFGNLKST
jgi:hypothetical protein